MPASTNDENTMPTVEQCSDAKSNSLILTDPVLLHPGNQSPLAETLEALKDLVNTLNVHHGVPSCLQVLHFKSFRRVIMIFSNTKIARIIYEYLSKLGLVVSFARRDNKLTECSIDTKDHQHDSMVTHLSKATGFEKLDPNNTPQTSPIDDKMPGAESRFGDEIYPLVDQSERLQVPENPVQMQSPPASPYEGWINRPEEAPCDTTIGFHPKTLGHLLYTYADGEDGDTNGDGSKNMKRVFSSFIDSEKPKSDEDQNLEELCLGEGLMDEEAMPDSLKGSLFQNFEPSNTARQPSHVLNIPIVVIDTSEAATLKTQAKEMDAREQSF